MDIRVTSTIPIYRSPDDTGVYIQWDINNPPSAELTFKIERAVSPAGPFEFVEDNIRTFYYYDRKRVEPAATPPDTRENLNFLSLMRTVYYRVSARAVSGETASITVDISTELPRRLFLLHRKMQRDFRLSLKFNGVNTFVLKRLHWGIRCKKCFDLLTKKVTASKCEACYGTGFDKGYADPMQVKMRFLAPNSDVQMSPQGLSDTTKIRVLSLQYPHVDPGDILVVKQSNMRYLVLQQSQTELQREIVHQALVVSELSRDSIEYRIAVNYEVVPVMY